MTTIEDLSPPYFDLVASWLSKRETNEWLTSKWRGTTVTAVTVSIVLRNKKNRVFLVRWGSQPVGLTALAEIDSMDSTAMIWYLMGEPTFGRRGIVSDALAQTARKCFQELKLESLYAWVMEDNLASARVLQKVGFRQAGKIRRATNSHGRQVDRIYYDLLPNECVG